MGKIIKNGVSYSGWGGSSGEGTTVIANPTGTATEDLNSIQIGEDIYSIPSSGGGGSGTITGDATVKWAGKSFTNQPSTYPYKKTITTVYSSDSGFASATGRYLFTDPDTQNPTYVNITADFAYTVNSGTKNNVTVYQNVGISSSDERGSGSVSVYFDSATADISGIDTFSGFNNLQTNVSNGNLYSFWPSSIECYYNGVQIQASYSGDTLRFLVASSIATISTTYDVMEAMGISLVVNSSDFSDIYTGLVNGEVLNKLRCIFENATYHLNSIPVMKLSDMSATTIGITAGAGILYFDAFEYNDITGTNYVYGQGTLRIVVPNSGGEYTFNGIMGIGAVDGNSISVIMGRGFLGYNRGEAYYVTDNASAFSINRTTSSLSGVYAEMI